MGGRSRAGSTEGAAASPVPCTGDGEGPLTDHPLNIIHCSLCPRYSDGRHIRIVCHAEVTYHAEVHERSLSAETHFTSSSFISLTSDSDSPGSYVIDLDDENLKLPAMLG
jgi:hypothetical protein